ncbi:MAG TPA: universal stress protein [Solirubrobacteraceae bacterium]|jgi:nucleotide-binding universal stress UspA family protein
MFSSIVVGTDGSDTATEAVRQAVEVAKTACATLEIVSAYAPVPEQQLRQERLEAPEDVQWAISPHQEVEASLSEAAEIAREAGIDVNTHACQGDPVDAIIDVAEENDADLVIVGNKRMSGFKRLLKLLLLPSVPNKVSRRAPCAVLIIKT